MKKKIVMMLIVSAVLAGAVGCGKTQGTDSTGASVVRLDVKEDKVSSVVSGDIKTDGINKTKFDDIGELDDSNSVKVPVAIFDSSDYDRKSDSFKNLGYIRIPNEYVVAFNFVDENGNRDSDLSGHDKAVHTMGAWISAKECADNGDFDKGYMYMGSFMNPDTSDAVSFTSGAYTQKACDKYFDGKTFKEKMDEDIASGGKRRVHILNINGNEIYAMNGWMDSREDYETGPRAYYFVDDCTYFTACMALGKEYNSDEDVDAFAYYVFRGFEPISETK